jgi:hypothetical protein
MRTLTILSAMIAVTALIVGVAGCTADDHNTMMIDPPVSGFTIAPADGATGVRLDAGITLSFQKKVDRAVTEANIRLISLADMADSNCPVNNMMGHTEMEATMLDSAMMGHLDDVHHAPGRFVWSGDSLECVFYPDSLMMTGMQYMIHMGPDMTKMMEDRMGSMDMMGGHGAGMMSDHMMFHFTTMDTTGAGSGHDGHH